MQKGIEGEKGLNMKRMIVMALILCAALVLMSACSGNSAAEGTDESSAASEGRDDNTEEEMDQSINIPQTGWTEGVSSDTCPQPPGRAVLTG